MDELWQRHKSFILQVLAGGFVFLIALIVLWNTYSGSSDPEEMRIANLRKYNALKQDVSDPERAPSKASIAAEEANARAADEQTRELAAKVASVAGDDETGPERAYVRENLRWTLANIGQPAKLDSFMNLYASLPTTALSRLRDEARNELVGRATLAGKEVDESLGISGITGADVVPRSLHGLAIVTDVVDRALGMEGITAVTDLRIELASRRREFEDATWLRELVVKLSVEGEPAAVMELLRSFNRREGNELGRATVVDTVDSIARIHRDQDAVKATVTLLGLQYVD